MERLQRLEPSSIWPDSGEYHRESVSEAVEQLEIAVVSLTRKMRTVKDELNEIDQALDKINNQ